MGRGESTAVQPHHVGEVRRQLPERNLHGGRLGVAQRPVEVKDDGNLPRRGAAHRVALTPGCQIGYTEYSGCQGHQLNV
jgi:hypothetical protein